MSEPSRKLKDALTQVRAPWDEARTERTLRVLPRRRRQKRMRTVLGVGSSALLALGCVWWLQRAPNPGQLPAPAPVVELASRAQPRSVVAPVQPLRLPDGSTVALLEAETAVTVKESGDQRMALHIEAGRARFDVPARGERVFELHTTQVTFEVLGSVFEVAQHGESTWLRVERGRVEVSSLTPRQTLEAGEEAWFPLPSSSSPESAEARESGREQNKINPGHKPGARPPSRSTATAQQPDDGWRDHAERGDFKQAFPLLPSADKMAAMSVSELMLAADAARLTGHPEAALPYLRRVVEQHAEDARAPLAAFTLGGVLMHQLGLPREAESAYAKARATSPSGALAQDALARQVEAAYRAGDEALARSLARDYLQHYPQGRRVHAVRRFGGL
jgi:transmembrane sensor